MVFYIVFPTSIQKLKIIFVGVTALRQSTWKIGSWKVGGTPKRMERMRCLEGFWRHPVLCRHAWLQAVRPLKKAMGIAKDDAIDIIPEIML